MFPSHLKTFEFGEDHSKSNSKWLLILKFNILFNFLIPAPPYFSDLSINSESLCTFNNSKVLIRAFSIILLPNKSGLLLPVIKICVEPGTNLSKRKSTVFLMEVNIFAPFLLPY
ncbi:hypothetical protein D3C87_1487480 [compost metagenome]